ncbi:aldehyde dehydrogenase (NADP(+)) [Enhygromyxa salina]|uniref:Alpha-ketoglutaric semialdehyde dehydrogenase n=1 Tax=Enhygromyxa salina TaxID=215803 RepID=A0A2S9YFL9_9BACT|nr:aldehyde dehydrogenase (NADP(+)) [Enhygromyxa salina]PRQ03903.1 Alpha-ketoglutaric semialdehyde dehydrogenase [Enhygromyxa salina]
MTLHGHHLIGLERRRDGAADHRAVAAATGEALEPAYANARAEELDAALHLATQAHAQAPLSAERRAAFLEAIATEIEAIGDALIERAMVETGLPQARLIGERGRTVGQLRMFAELVREGSWVGARIDRALPDRKPFPRPQLGRMLVPIGPVAIFGAGNFPLAFSVAGGDTASAVAAGCPVVVKAHPSHPGTSELVGEAIAAAVRASGLHPGSFALVHGHDHAVGQLLVRHPLTRAVGFTGSLRGGRALVEAAAARACPIPVFAEMGSINPVFVLPSALATRSSALAVGVAGSLTMGVGQFCTNPGVILVPDGEAGDRFVAALTVALADVGPGVMLDPRILAGYEAGVSRRAAAAGIVRLSTPRPEAGRAQAELFTIDAENFIAQPALHEELFGPAGLIVRYRDDDELVGLATSFEGQLSATIHVDEADAADLQLAARLIHALRDRVGRLLFNGFPTGVEVSPAMQHGGPWPASSDARTTSVGTAALERFARPICFQDLPDALLPPELQAANPRGLLRIVDGHPTRAPL